MAPYSELHHKVLQEFEKDMTSTLGWGGEEGLGGKAKMRFYRSYREEGRALASILDVQFLFSSSKKTGFAP